jgi:hypothetical protein
METPELKMCPKCGAKWIDGQLYWSTGAKATNADLAGLVCDNLKEDVDQCINELRGTNHGGDTWEKRSAKLDEITQEIKDQLDRDKE